MVGDCEGGLHVPLSVIALGRSNGGQCVVPNLEGAGNDPWKRPMAIVTRTGDANQDAILAEAETDSADTTIQKKKNFKLGNQVKFVKDQR